MVRVHDSGTGAEVHQLQAPIPDIPPGGGGGATQGVEPGSPRYCGVVHGLAICRFALWSHICCSVGAGFLNVVLGLVVHSGWLLYVVSVMSLPADLQAGWGAPDPVHVTVWLLECSVHAKYSTCQGRQPM